MITILFFRKITNNSTKEETMLAPVNQEKLLEDFYNHLGDKIFLGNEFFSDKRLMTVS